MAPLVSIHNSRTMAEDYVLRRLSTRRAGEFLQHTYECSACALKLARAELFVRAMQEAARELTDGEGLHAGR